MGIRAQTWAKPTTTRSCEIDEKIRYKESQKKSPPQKIFQLEPNLNGL